LHSLLNKRENEVASVVNTFLVVYSRYLFILTTTTYSFLIVCEIVLLSLFIVYSHACLCVKIRSISFFDIEKHATANSRWKAYEGVVEDGKLFYKNSGEMLQTSTMDNNDSKWIMVLRCYTLGRRVLSTFKLFSWRSYCFCMEICC
ncbi:unnamed protein product, partial [Brassica oleracea]